MIDIDRAHDAPIVVLDSAILTDPRVRALGAPALRVWLWLRAGRPEGEARIRCKGVSTADALEIPARSWWRAIDELEEATLLERQASRPGGPTTHWIVRSRPLG